MNHIGIVAAMRVHVEPTAAPPQTFRRHQPITFVVVRGVGCQQLTLIMERALATG
jgi:hypothetical protein